MLMLSIVRDWVQAKLEAIIYWYSIVRLEGILSDESIRENQIGPDLLSLDSSLHKNEHAGQPICHWLHYYLIL